MSDVKTIYYEHEIDSYSIIPTVLGHEVMLFIRYGDYQGTFLIVSIFLNDVYLWRGYYGSCTECDPLEHFLYGNRDYSIPRVMSPYYGWEVSGWHVEKLLVFAKDYKPFLVIDMEIWEFIVASAERLATVLPANERYYDDWSVEQVVADIIQAWQKRNEQS